MADAKKYSDDEVQKIIERALEAEGAPASVITHGDLLAIGEQVGVTPEVMTRAAREVSQARLDLSATTTIKSRRRKLLAVHAVLFALMNALFFTVNALTTPGEWWFLFSVFFWGLGLAAHAGVALGLGISKSAVERERRKLEAHGVAAQRLRVGDEPRVVGEASADAEADEKAASHTVSRS